MNKKQIIGLSLFFLSFCIITTTFAEPSSIGDIASNLFQTTTTIHDLFKTVLIIAGAALILGSILQYKKYRENPIETRLSTVIFIFLLGILLIILAFIPMPGITI